MSNSIDIDQAAARPGIADYRFVRVLGAGNHGVFYLARRPERLPVDCEFVAVKVLSGVSGQDTFRRAVRELKAFAAVKSPYLVTLYDAGQQGDDLYYAMEYLGGGSLAAPAERRSRAVTLRAIANAARAAHALHEAGIAHNDIKPSNILLFPGGGKLADLGLSRTLAPGLAVSGLGPPASAESANLGSARAGSTFQVQRALYRVQAGYPHRVHRSGADAGRITVPEQRRVLLGCDAALGAEWDWPVWRSSGRRHLGGVAAGPVSASGHIYRPRSRGAIRHRRSDQRGPVRTAGGRAGSCSSCRSP